MNQLDDINKHKVLAEHYWGNALKLLDSGEHQKVSELLWGFLTQAIMTYALATGITRIGTHAQLVGFCAQLSRSLDDPYFKNEFKALEALHVNFYQSSFDFLEVRDLAIRTHAFVDRLWALKT